MFDPIMMGCATAFFEEERERKKKNSREGRIETAIKELRMTGKTIEEMDQAVLDAILNNNGLFRLTEHEANYIRRMVG